MYFNSAIVHAIFTASTLAIGIARPSDGPSARLNARLKAHLSKRADFDPVKACEDWRPRGKEWGLITTLSHNVIFAPEQKNFDTEVTEGIAFLVDNSCKVLATEQWVARGGGNGFEVNFKNIQGYDVRGRIASMGPAWGIKDAEVQTNGKDVAVECTGTRNNVEGLDVDMWSSCTFA